MNSAQFKPKIASRRRWLTGVFVCAWAAAILVGVWYYQPIYNAIKNMIMTAGGGALTSIKVEGLVYTEASGLQEALAIKAGDPLVPYDVSAARERLEALPWVRLATIGKQLPETLNVSIYEYKPIARVQEDDVWHVVSKDAVRILVDTENQFVHLPALAGAGAVGAAVDLLAHLQEHPNMTAQLKTAHYVGERRWDFTFKGGVLVRFPAEDMAGAFVLLKELEAARHVLSLKGGVVDLRLPGKVMLKIPPEINKTPVL